MFKGVLFDLDDTLYDASLQLEMARMNAVKAMLEAGLPVDVEKAFKTLNEVVEEYGRHYPKHFDRMLERLGVKWDAKIIAAGVVAYRETSWAFLKPYPDTIPTLLTLRDHGYRIGLVSGGDPVKQWQKLIKINVHHLLHGVVMTRELGRDRIDENILLAALEDLKLKPGEAILVGGGASGGIAEANVLGMTTVRLRRKPHQEEKGEAAPTHEIDRLSDLLKIIKSNLSENL